MFSVGPCRDYIWRIETQAKIWCWAPDGGLAPGQTGRLTVSRNITLIFLKLVTHIEMIEAKALEYYYSITYSN
jgi:hypothetical protein